MYYKSLFHINIHHGYFLDKGEKKFLKVDNSDTPMTTDEKKEALKEYDLTDYLTILPTKFTQAQFKNYRLVMRLNKEGFRVMGSTLEKEVNNQKKYKPIIPIDEDVYFTFQVQASDAYFYNYSNVSETTEKKMYLFTNVEPANQNNEFENLFEKKGGLIDSRFQLKEEATRDLLKAIALEDEKYEDISEKFSLGKSIQSIQNDENLTANEKNEEITALLNDSIQKKKQKQILGYIRLRIKGDDVSRHLLEFDSDTQYIKQAVPQFTISFINLKTFWKYISLKDEATLTTKATKWLSKNGFVEITGADFDNAGLDPPSTDPDDCKFPNPAIDLIKKENSNYYSEIFI